MVVLPAYNVAGNILNVITGTIEVVGDPGCILVVDDGSTDGTGQVCRQLPVVLLQHRKNRGKGAALRTGFSYALDRGIQKVVTLDADGQHDPRFIPQFTGLLEEQQLDLVLGIRTFAFSQMPKDRWLSNQLTSLLISVVAGKRIADSQCGYRAMNLEIYRRLRFFANRYDFETEVLLKYLLHGARTGFVEISRIYGGQKSSINRLTDTIRFIRTVLRVALYES
jgi:glycosyltransferase involved in cell wall biosynthesis